MPSADLRFIHAEYAARLTGTGAAMEARDVDLLLVSDPAASFAALTRGLPDAQFSDATALVNWQRAVKSATEIGYRRTVARNSGRCTPGSPTWGPRSPSRPSSPARASNASQPRHASLR